MSNTNVSRWCVHRNCRQACFGSNEFDDATLGFGLGHVGFAEWFGIVAFDEMTARRQHHDLRFVQRFSERRERGVVLAVGKVFWVTEMPGIGLYLPPIGDIDDIERVSAISNASGCGK